MFASVFCCYRIRFSVFHNALMNVILHELNIKQELIAKLALLKLQHLGTWSVQVLVNHTYRTVLHDVQIA